MSAAGRMSSASLLVVKAEPAEARVASRSGGSSALLLKSVDELRGLSSAVSVFTSRWDDLQAHLESIQGSIAVLEGSGTAAHLQPAADLAASPGSQAGEPRDELETICESGNGKALRKYVIARLSDTANLREQLQAALKRAPDVGKLVMSCIGRFCLQGSKAFERKSPIVSVRQACILILECFLLADGCSKPLDSFVKEEAEEVARAWKARLIKEGGIEYCRSVDAQGLLLFISSFGIPSGFSRAILLTLMRSSNLPKDFAALRSAPILQQKLEGMLQKMVHHGSYVDAVDLACTFGLEEKFPPTDLLSTFLKEIDKNGKQMRREAQGSGAATKAAYEKQLTDLKSVVECLSKHKLDPATFANWEIDQKISKLKKEISSLVSRANEVKRKASEHAAGPEEPLNLKRHIPNSLSTLQQLAGPGSGLLPHQEHSSDMENGLAMTKVFDSPYMRFVDGYSGALQSPNARYLSGFGRAGGSEGQLFASTGHESTYLRQKAMVDRDIYAETVPLGESGGETSSQNRVDGLHGWHQRNAAAVYSVVSPQQGSLEYYYQSAGGRQGYGGAPSYINNAAGETGAPSYLSSAGGETGGPSYLNRSTGASNLYHYADSTGFNSEASYPNDPVGEARAPVYHHRNY